jgi:cytochrome c-type biogenesis protein CcmH/NrfG
LPFSVRAGNAFVSYVRYLGKTFWPHALSAFYPFPTPPAGPSQVVPAVAFFVAATIGALAVARRWPWVTFGWLWFVLTPLPVMGFLQAGDQAMADRYMYLPHVGLFAAFVWCAAEAVRGPRRREVLGAALAAALVACVVGTRMQIRWWKDTPTLYRHMLAVDEANYLAHENLATWLSGHGHLPESVSHFRRAIELQPRLALAYASLGNALRQMRDYSGAERELARAIQISPDLPAAHFMLAMVDDDQGKHGPAAGHLAKVIAVEPGNRRAWEGLAAILREPGAAGEALPFVAAVAKAEPQSREVRELVEVMRRQAAATSSTAPAVPAATAPATPP